MREIKEELTCKIETADLFHDYIHEYENFIINLIAINCRIVDGTPTPIEHSTLIWLEKENLESFKWARLMFRQLRN